MRGLVLETSDATLDELVEQLGSSRITTSRSGFDRYFGSIGWNLRRTLHATEQNRLDVKTAREGWREQQPALDINSLVIIDKSGLTANMVRRSSRCPVGQKLLAKTPHGHWRTTTFIAALRWLGSLSMTTLDGPMDGEDFRAWIEQFLAPALRPNDIVVMDKLPSHKVTGIRQAIEAQGAQLLHLPSYNRDLNPIEMAFAKFRAALRKAACRQNHRKTL